MYLSKHIYVHGDASWVAIAYKISNMVFLFSYIYIDIYIYTILEKNLIN